MKKIFYSFMIGALALSIASCKDDKAKDPDGPGDVSGSMEELSASESKKFLAETANEFLNKFSPSQQQDIIKLSAYFEDTYGDLDMPKEFEIEEEITEPDPLRLIKAFAATFGEGNATRAGAAAITYTYTLDFDKFKGVYIPGGSRWVKANDSNDIIFRFNDASGNQCELKAELSGDKSSGTISWDEDYYDYYEGDVTEEYVYNINIPKDVTVTLTQGGKNLANAKVNSSIDFKKHTINVTANVTAANISTALKVDGSDTQVTQTSSLTVSGEELVATSATVTGNHLCDYEFFINNEDEDTQDLLPQVLSTGKATVSVLKKVRIDANGTYSNDLYEALDTEYDNYEFKTQNAAETAVNKAIDTLNKQIKAEVRYNNKETVQATLTWDYDLDTWGSNSFEYYIVPQITFVKDQTSYTFDEYFSKGFSSVENAWEDLQESYKKVWDAAKKGR